MIAKYAIFGWNTYYPAGGLEDCIGYADTLEDAVVCFESWLAANEPTYPMGHIVKIEAMQSAATFNDCVEAQFDCGNDPVWSQAGVGPVTRPS